MDVYFTQFENNRFQPGELCRGPWDINACHAGPPSGLIARAAERCHPDKQLVRLTLDLLRPVPMPGFTIEAEISKQGRMMGSCSIKLMSLNGKLCVHAHSVHLAVSDQGELPTVELPVPEFGNASPGGFPLAGRAHDLRSFADSAEVIYPPGQDGRPGPTTLWMRTPALLADEEMSGFQRICPLADCGNGISRNANVSEATFMNPDLTIALHRLPESDWLASSAHCVWQPNGIGLSQATLFDRVGAVGVATQTLLVSRR